ncbi:hypothetical protein P5673_004855 [Acropora cervicornis]|uniref:Uncharacterized protein n=1 Tax=Acropora cervicornis TaxID=6130 RepID=A0AAD9VD54_ACRCE|nr:hypothetical protein P5673_004855 [Acropora cervicornis]
MVQSIELVSLWKEGESGTIAAIAPKIHAVFIIFATAEALKDRGILLVYDYHDVYSDEYEHKRKISHYLARPTTLEDIEENLNACKGIAIKGLNKLLFVEGLKFTFLKKLASFRFTGYCSGDLSIPGPHARLTRSHSPLFKGENKMAQVSSQGYVGVLEDIRRSLTSVIWQLRSPDSNCNNCIFQTASENGIRMANDKAVGKIQDNSQNTGNPLSPMAWKTALEETLAERWQVGNKLSTRPQKQIEEKKKAQRPRSFIIYLRGKKLQKSTGACFKHLKR